MFNTILLDAGVSLADVCLLRHQDQRAARGRTPYELWRDDTPAFDLYQSHQGTDGRSKFSRAHHWASFVGTPGGETLFVGLYRAQYCGLLDHDTPMPHRDGIDKAGTCDVYDLSLCDSLTDLIGKLYICPKTKESTWAQQQGSAGSGSDGKTTHAPGTAATLHSRAVPPATTKSPSYKSPEQTPPPTTSSQSNSVG